MGVPFPAWSPPFVEVIVTRYRVLQVTLNGVWPEKELITPSEFAKFANVTTRPAPLLAGPSLKKLVPLPEEFPAVTENIASTVPLIRTDAELNPVALAAKAIEEMMEVRTSSFFTFYSF
jgi:hypothetical protein